LNRVIIIFIKYLVSAVLMFYAVSLVAPTDRWWPH